MDVVRHGLAASWEVPSQHPLGGAVGTGVVRGGLEGRLDISEVEFVALQLFHPVPVVISIGDA